MSGQGGKSLSPKTQKNDDDNAIRKIIKVWCFIDCLPNCIAIIVFLGLGREILLLARYTHRSLLQSPAYLAHTSTVSLSLL